VNHDRIQALLLEALGYQMSPMARGLVRDAVAALAPKFFDIQAFVEEDAKGLKYLDFTDPTSGVPWRMVVIRNGDFYGVPHNGKRACLNRADTMIEFWDRRHNHDAEHQAQFVSRYYLTSILDCCDGLILDGGVPDWQLSKESMQMCLRMLAKYKTA
jgi:hypothetical protein